jgi:hypothetical protein
VSNELHNNFSQSLDSNPLNQEIGFVYVSTLTKVVQLKTTGLVSAQLIINTTTFLLS